MKKPLVRRLFGCIGNVGKRFRAFCGRGDGSRETPSKPSSGAVEKEFLTVASARRTCLRRLALALRPSSTGEEPASADGETLIDYGGDFLEAGEDPAYFARQAKQRRSEAREARRLARRHGLRKAKEGLVAVFQSLDRQLRRERRK